MPRVSLSLTTLCSVGLIGCMHHSPIVVRPAEQVSKPDKPAPIAPLVGEKAKGYFFTDGILHLGCESPGIEIVLGSSGGMLPREAGQALYLKRGEEMVRIDTFNQLRGHVEIDDAAAALRYVRLLTSRAPWYLWKKGPCEVEVMRPAEAVTASDYGLPNCPVLLYTPWWQRTVNGRSETVQWWYDSRDGKMRLERIGFLSGGGEDKIIQTMDPPDLSILGDGMMGVISNDEFRMGDFSAARTEPDGHGFAVTRWVYESQTWNDKGSLRHVRESVARDGGYSREILETRDTSRAPEARFTVMRFE